MIDGALVPASVGGRLPSREPCVSSRDPPERRTSVDFISTCPRKSLTRTRGTPDWRRCIAFVCLMVWGLIPTRAKSGHGGCGPAQVLQQNVSSAVPAQPAAPPVLQEWLLFVELTPPGAQELSDQPCGLRQQWA